VRASGALGDPCMTTSPPIGLTFQPDLYERVLSLLPADRGVRILDAGAGQGYLSAVARAHGWLHVTACDVRADAFKAVGVPFCAGDLRGRLPFADGAFDCVVSLEVVEHIADQPAYFAELFRVLRPGGLLIVSTPNVQSLSSRVHFLAFGCTDGARRPLNPGVRSWQQHTHCVSLQQLLYYVGHGGAVVERIATNRRRAGSLLLLPLYPVVLLAMLSRLRRRRYRGRQQLYLQYVRHVLSPATLLGRILILTARKTADAPIGAVAPWR